MTGTLNQFVLSHNNLPLFNLGSINLSDDAMMRACYTVRFMFADRADTRQSYYKYYGRFALIGAYERTTQIPEFSDMDPCWDQRARGFGATPWKPVSLGAEENALCYNNDRCALI